MSSALGSTSLRRDYAAAVKCIFSNADFTSAAKRYANPQENWRRYDELLERLGRPAGQLKVVHIAGTNGKGTTSALCEAMLRASGARVGLFTSPHLHSFRERIRVDGALVSREAVVEAMTRVSAAVEAVGYASPFEKLSALALVCFQNAGLEWAVLETGLGGRWDATNHCAPLVCGISRIGLDHMNVLGSTVGQIASEKAGIIKPGVPAFSVPQEADALAVLRSAAADVGVELGECSRDDLDSPAELPPWLSPVHQQLNAALATAMMRSLEARGLLKCDAAARAAAIASAAWPARYELLRPVALCGGQLLLDVAHNEPAVTALVSSVEAAFTTAPMVAIFGANRDKDAASMIAQLQRLLPRLRLCIAVAADHPKAFAAAEIERLGLELAGAEAEGGAPALWRAAESVAQAVEYASQAVAREGGDVEQPLVLCCGSVFVVAGMRAHLAAIEPSLFSPSDWVFEESGEPPLLM